MFMNDNEASHKSIKNVNQCLFFTILLPFYTSPLFLDLFCFSMEIVYLCLLCTF